MTRTTSQRAWASIAWAVAAQQIVVHLAFGALGQWLLPSVVVSILLPAAARRIDLGWRDKARARWTAILFTLWLGLAASHLLELAAGSGFTTTHALSVRLALWSWVLAVVVLSEDPARPFHRLIAQCGVGGAICMSGCAGIGLRLSGRSVVPHDPATELIVKSALTIIPIAFYSIPVALCLASIATRDFDRSERREDPTAGE